MAKLLETLVSCDFLRLSVYCSKTGDIGYVNNMSETLDNLNILESVCDIKGDKVRIHKKEYHEKDDLWELQILRYRDKVLPGISDDSTGEYELIKVDDGKRLAEFNTLIYDPKNHCILLHRNRNGLNVNFLETYLNQLIKINDDKQIQLSPIIKNFDKNKYKGKNGVIYRKLDFSIDIADVKNNSILDFFENVEKTNGVRLGCTLSMAHSKKDKSLDKNLIEKILDSDINASGWNSLKLGLKENENAAIETIDLIRNRMCTAHEFTYSAEKPIDHEDIYKMFSRDYKKNYRSKKPVVIKK